MRDFLGIQDFDKNVRQFAEGWRQAPRWERAIMKFAFVLLLLIAFLMSHNANAQQPEDNLPETVQIAGLTAINIGGGVTAAGCGDANCPSGTYLSRWNGDYSGDTDKICYNSCASSKDATTIAAGIELGAYGNPSNGARVTDANEYVLWTVASDDLIDKALGTICIDIYVDTEDITDDFCFCEASDGSMSSNSLRINVENSDAVRAYYYSNAAEQYVTTTAAITKQTWVTVKYSWSDADNKHKVSFDGASSDEDEEAIAPSASFTELTIGENRSNTYSAHPYQLDNLRVYGTYDAT